MNLKEAGINVSLMMAGFFGSLLSVKSDAHKDWWTTIASVLAGTLSANYLTPLVIEWTNMTSQNKQFATAFLLGFLGLRGVELVMAKVGFTKDPTAKKKK